MGRRFTFIHAADLHLGAPLRSLNASSSHLAKLLSHASSRAFDKLVYEAASRKVDLVVLAGDVFDRKAPSFAEYMQFLDGLKRLDDAGIQVFIVSGNHDPREAWMSRFADMPENTTVVLSEAPEYMVVSRNGDPLAVIVGKGFSPSSRASFGDLALKMNRNAVLRTCKESIPFVLGVLHTGLSVDTSIAPVSSRELLACGLDYWALGHLHAPYCDSSQNPCIVYPGCIQGNDINEPGVHGCFLVTLEEGRSNRTEFIALSSIVWERVDVDVHDCVTVDDVYRSVLRQLMRTTRSIECERLFARVTLSGISSLYSIIDQVGVLESVRQRLNAATSSFYCDEIKNKTRPLIDRQAIMEEGLFSSEVLSQSRILEDSGDVKEYLRACFSSKGIVVPEYGEDELFELCQQAEFFLLSMIQGDFDG